MLGRAVGENGHDTVGEVARQPSPTSRQFGTGACGTQVVLENFGEWSISLRPIFGAQTCLGLRPPPPPPTHQGSLSLYVTPPPPPGGRPHLKQCPVQDTTRYRHCSQRVQSLDPLLWGTEGQLLPVAAWSLHRVVCLLLDKLHLQEHALLCDDQKSKACHIQEADSIQRQRCSGGGQRSSMWRTMKWLIRLGCNFERNHVEQEFKHFVRALSTPLTPTLPKLPQDPDNPRHPTTQSPWTTLNCA